ATRGEAAGGVVGASRAPRPATRGEAAGGVVGASRAPRHATWGGAAGGVVGASRAALAAASVSDWTRTMEEPLVGNLTGTQPNLSPETITGHR
ncbi:hypothetical protein ACFQKG_31365, partial [Streptomyces caelestis]